jgi:2-keto-4-pentenoate hydratase/2-oxohepta-3-ene-1,7-dioic acid hydratase in catechol pathway
MNLWVMFGSSEFCTRAWGVERRDIPLGYLVPKAASAAQGEALALPDLEASRVTAFGGFALEIGRTCKNVPPPAAEESLAGVRLWIGLHTTHLTDWLARLGHQVRVRDHGISLYYGLWFERSHAFGPLMPLSSFLAQAGDPAQLSSASGRTARQLPSDYSHSPATVVSFLSRFMTLNPGDRVALGALCGFTLESAEAGMRLDWAGQSLEARLQSRRSAP